LTKVTPKGYWYKELDSTMDEAKRLIKTGEIKDTAFIVSESQTSGRGTRGRVWDSPCGSGIYLSIVHLPEEGRNFELTTLYTLAAGVACVEAIKDVLGLKVFLKPINDIYAEEKKLGGILVESTLHKSAISALVTGIGINTHKTLRNLDMELTDPVSVQELVPDSEFQNFSKEKLIESIVNKVCSCYGLVFNKEHLKVQQTWDSYKINP